MDRRTAQLSFTGGELSPELFGRPDAVQYRTGAAKISNWLIKPQGPVRTRPGFRHVATSDDLGSGGGTRLIPFIYSTGESYVIELGRRDSEANTHANTAHTYARFYTRGAAVKWAVPVELGEASACLDPTTSTLRSVRRHGFGANLGTYIFLLAEFGGTLPTGYNSATGAFTRDFTSVFTTKQFQLGTASSGGSQITLSGGDGKLYAFRASDIPAAWTISPVQGTFVQSGATYVRGDMVYWPGDATYQAGVYHCRMSHTPGVFATDAGNGRWHIQPADGTLEVRLPTANYYAQADLSKLVWRQSGDTLWLANSARSYPLLQIERVSPLLWRSERSGFNSRLAPPSGLRAVPFRGDGYNIIGTDHLNNNAGATINGRACVQLSRYVPVTFGDACYIKIETGITNATGTASTSFYLYNEDTGTTSDFVDGIYVIDGTQVRVENVGMNLLAFKSIDGQSYLATNRAGGPFPTSATGVLNVSSVSAETEHRYKVTSVDDDDLESEPSAEELVQDQVLSARGAKTTLTWDRVSGAKRYRVYKKKSGLFGYIGEVDDVADVEFVDDNIAPDLGRTPPIDDPTITERDTVTRRPGAVGGYEQRMLLAATDERPQTVWASKSGTDLDFTFTLPTQADNRLRFTLASNQSQTIKHMIGLRDLIVLTQSGEWRVRAGDDGALTPSTVFARQEGFVGANNVQPASLNNTVVYVAARGGHVRKIGYEASRAGFSGQDASLRAAHLFDELNVVALSAGKSPFPIVWAVSTSGKLLGLTFIPEEQVEGWHQHTTNGTFLDCCSVPEFDRDVLYVTVEREDSAGNTVRSIERMQEWLSSEVTEQACVDDHTSTYVSPNPGHPYDAGVRVLASSGTSAGSTIQLQGRSSDDSSTQVAFDFDDVGDQVWVYPDKKTPYRAKITGYINPNLVDAELLDDLPPTTLTTIPEADWRFVRRRVYTAARHAGRVMTMVADGVASTVTPVASTQVRDAYVDLPEPALNVHIGEAFTCDLQTLPVAVQIEGLGMGREKNVDRVWMRVLDASGLQVGPGADNLVAVSDIQTSASLQDGEKRTLVSPSWNEDGQVLVRQAQPYPATVLSLSAQVSFGS